MDLSSLSRLALKHAKNAAAEALYLRGVADLTRPTVVYGIVNERCNYACRYCEFWRMPQYMEELSIEDWKRALGDLQGFIGHFHVEFWGGEPFIKKGFMDLCEWCYAQGIGWGVTTNGSAMSPKIVERLVGAKPFNVNVSIDSHDPAVHDYSRGVEGSLAKLTEGLTRLLAARDAEGLSFPVMVKPVVHRLNFRDLPETVRWVERLGPAVVNMQPVDRWTPETYDELWIEAEEIPALEGVVAELIRMKRAGAPILNSELILEAWPMHFREEKAPPETMPCLVGLRNYFIRPNGNVEVCWFYPPIGNVKTESARAIWAGEAAKSRRAETVACDKLCLFTCLSQKTLVDKAKMGMELVRRSRQKLTLPKRSRLNVVQ